MGPADRRTGRRAARGGGSRARGRDGRVERARRRGRRRSHLRDVRIYIAGVGLEIAKIPAGPDFEFPLDGIMRALTPRTRLVYLADPNNPTGQPIPDGAIQKIAEAVPDAVVARRRGVLGIQRPQHHRPDAGSLSPSHRRTDVCQSLRIGRAPRGRAGGASGDARADAAWPAAVQRERLRVARARSRAGRPRARPVVHRTNGREPQRRVRLLPPPRPALLAERDEFRPRAPRRAGADDHAGRGPRRASSISGRSHQFGCAGTVRITTGVLEHTMRLLEALELVL